MNTRMKKFRIALGVILISVVVLLVVTLILFMAEGRTVEAIAVLALAGISFTGSIGAALLTYRSGRNISAQRTAMRRLEVAVEKLAEAESRHSYHTLNAAREASTYSRQASDSLYTWTAPPKSTAKSSRSERRVLFVTSNGSGLGHITRCIAIADAGVRSFESVIVTLSTGAGHIESQHRIFHFPSRRPGEEGRFWNISFQRQLLQLIDQEAINTVVFDGPALFAAVSGAASMRSCRLVWLLRGLWKPELPTSDAHLAAQLCDVIITPSEGGLAEPESVVPLGLNARVVDPIIRLPEEGFTKRSEARAELGIPDSVNAVLLSLGALSQRGWAEAEDTICRGLLDIAPDTRVYVLRSPIDSAPVPENDQVSELHRYPIAPLLRAFNLVVCAAGYNSVHEVIAASIPAVLIPNPASVTDDQGKRAVLAETRYPGEIAAADQPSKVAEKLVALVSSGASHRVDYRGAEQAAAIIASVQSRGVRLNIVDARSGEDTDVRGTSGRSDYGM